MKCRQILLAITASVVLLAVVPPIQAQITSGEALESARSLMDDVVEFSLEFPQEPAAQPAWTGAVAGEPLLIHSYPELQPSYYLVPVKNDTGRLVSVIGISADDGQWLWYSSLRGEDGLLKVGAERAGAVIDARFGTDGSANVVVPVMMPDKRIYWTHRSSGFPATDEYFVDAGDADRSFSLEEAIKAGVTRPSGPMPGMSVIEDNTAPEDSTTGYFPTSYDITSVPHYYQGTFYHCGPTSDEMVFDYWGPHVNQTDIGYVANAKNWGTWWGVYADDLRRASHFSHISTAIQDASLTGYDERDIGYGSLDNWWSYPDTSDPDYPDRYNDLKTLVYNDYPILILTAYDSSHSSGHFRVIKGYNDSTDVFIVHDPWYDPPYYGPNVNFNQSFLVDNLWLWWYRWGMHSSPWPVAITSPANVDCCAQFTVSATVSYLGPHPYGNQDTASDPEASITLPSGFTLAGGETQTKTISGISRSGSSGDVSWQVIAPSAEASGQILIDAQGEISDSSTSYTAYTDLIGGSGARNVHAVGTDSDCDGFTDDVDCVPGNSAVYPGAEEVNDGIDNQCPGDPGYGMIDEIGVTTGFHDGSDKSEYSWQSQSGADSYEAARSNSPDFGGATTCFPTTETFINDYDEPSSSGMVFHYIVRAAGPHQGSWGQDSLGSERSAVCP